MVDQVLLERIVSDIKANVSYLREASDISWEVYQSDRRARRFIERTLHILIEACLDAAQHIISDEQFREPANYRDTFVVLAEQGVIQREELPRFERMASFRNLIVHYYERIDDAIVYGVFKRNLEDFDIFVEKILDYLKERSSKE
ncbi:DUF86 domain-containing protein [Bradyrhizobium sp.]|uniref:type VII toxin-antitoxin system HepT family RNase toxin n=1 Tax=Bradyrhizobium sp. TaxID=376 RepID=UPI0025BEA1C1|nr:DUF86 domain-containing protein [Bradyrhizobium sp.]